MKVEMANHLCGVVLAAIVRRQSRGALSPAPSGFGGRPRSRTCPWSRLSTTPPGHSSIQIDEQSLGDRGYLYFNTLESWAFSKDSPDACPQSVMEADGKKVKMMGFMYPAPGGGESQGLLPAAEHADVLLRPAAAVQPVRLRRDARAGEVRAARAGGGGGQVRRRSQARRRVHLPDGGQSVRPAVPNDQPASAEEFARQNNLPIFDFAPLEAAKTAAGQGGGYRRSGRRPGRQADGRQRLHRRKTQDCAAEDHDRQVCLGRQGQGHAAEPVQHGAGQPQEPRATCRRSGGRRPCSRARFTSRKTRPNGPRTGIVSLQDAVLAVAPASAGAMVDIGPLLPPSYEWLILAAWAASFLPAVISRIRGRNLRKTGDST